MIHESEDSHIARERIATEAIARTGSLDLSNLQLSKLPAELFCLQYLQELNCSETQVSDLSPLAGLTALQGLDCSRTQVRDLSPLAALTALQELRCYSTKIIDLSPLAGLTVLQVLYCSHTQISDLSPLAGLTALQGLKCYNTQISDLSPLARLTALQELDCGGTEVSDLSPLARLTALQRLDCSATQVGNLSPLKGLTSLQELDCSGTQVSDLSPLAGLTALQGLYCSAIHVSDLSPLAGLTALQELDCMLTQVGDLSPLAGLTVLQVLYCSETQVSDLSPLAGLTALRELVCSHTLVDDLSALTGLTALQTLVCNHCSLSHVPRRLLDIPVLEKLYLYKTRIPDIPPEVLSEYEADNCLYSFRAYFSALKSGEIEIRDTKLLILGNGRIGKTQICRRLRGEAYDEDVSSTHGIIVSSAILSQEDDQPIRLHLWDFGGQDIYHSTHALFMRTRAVFLLVWIPEAEETLEYEHEDMIFRNRPLSYWLAYIRYLSGLDNPVLLVQTRCDRPEDERRKLPLANEVQMLEGFRYCKPLQYSSLKNRGRASLDEVLRDATSWLREQQGKVLIGRGWMRVKQRLEEMRDADAALPSEQRQYRTLSQEHFHQICMEGNGDIELTDSKYLLEYLHNIGIVFYRQGLFHDEIILDQGWALEAIYTVFHREKCYRQLQNSQGRFTRSLLEAFVWQDYSIKEQELFLGMMQSCGICFIHKRGDEALGIEHEYIAPDLLPDKAEVALELEDKWDSGIPVEEAAFEYELHQPGLLRSFISEIGGKAGVNAVYWKDGLYFYEKISRSRALIEQKTRDGWHGVISIQTQKGNAAALLAQLTERLTNEQERWGVRHEKSSSTLLSNQSKLESEKISLVEPEPSKLKFIQEPSGKTEYCVSYAWGDKTKEGKEREAIVDQLCSEAEAHGVRISRDKSELRPGDSISKFMERIGEADRIFVVLSDKYLKSPYCMYELSEIWRNSRQKGDEFLRRVRAYALPDTPIFTPFERGECAEHWEKELKKLKQHLDRLGEIDLIQYRRMKSFAHNVGDILATITNTVMPRNFEELVQYGFSDLGRGT